MNAQGAVLHEMIELEETHDAGVGVHVLVRSTVHVLLLDLLVVHVRATSWPSG